MTTDEVTSEEFFKLEKRLAVAKGKTSPELLERLTVSGLSTIKVAEFLGVSKEAAYSRLRILQKKGFVEERYSGKKAFWFITSRGRELLESIKQEVKHNEI